MKRQTINEERHTKRYGYSGMLGYEPWGFHNIFRLGLDATH